MPAKIHTAYSGLRKFVVWKPHNAFDATTDSFIDGVKDIWGKIDNADLDVQWNLADHFDETAIARTCSISEKGFLDLRSLSEPHHNILLHVFA